MLGFRSTARLVVRCRPLLPSASLSTVLWMLFAIAPCVAVAVDLEIHYADEPGEGFFDPQLGAARRTSFEFAVDIWRFRLRDVPGEVDIQVAFDPLGGSSVSAVLGMAGPTAYTTELPEPAREDWAYPISLANVLTGGNLNGSDADIRVTFNSDVDSPEVLGSIGWYYGYDWSPPGRDLDFVTVAIHELTHGLGFLSTFKADGAWGIDFGDLGVRPSPFDWYLENSSGDRLVDLPVSSDNVTSPVFWSGPQGMAAYQAEFGGSKPRIYSPSQFKTGSSLSHLDETGFTGNFELMTPVYSGPVHDPDAIVRGMLDDLGWQVLPIGDATGDGYVDLSDILLLVSAWGTGYGSERYDFRSDLRPDGSVNVLDLMRLADNFGSAAPWVFDAAGSDCVPGEPGCDLDWRGRPWVVQVDNFLPVSFSVPEPASALLMLLVAWGASVMPRAGCRDAPTAGRKCRRDRI